MRIAALVLGAVVAVGASGSAMAGPAEARGAIVVVGVKGVNTRLGNAPEAAQGTGFFISKDGLLVTAYHLWGDMEQRGVDPATMSIEVTFDPDSPKTVQAQQLYTNRVADVMVLYAPVGGRNVPTLKPADRTTAKVVEASTPIYSAGYPDGIGFSVSRGYIKSFDGPRAPVPAWTTDITFKGGESGSPILLEDNRVIAIAKAVDKESTQIGLIVPSRFVPRDYWDGAGSDSLLASTAGRVLVEARSTVAAPEVRTRDITFANPSCAGARDVANSVTARPGWTIDPASVKLQTLQSTGADNKVDVATAAVDGIRLQARLVNLGQCLQPFGMVTQRDVPATITARISYSETPIAPATVWRPVSETNLAKAVLTPLPSGEVRDLRFSYIAPNGQVLPFRPAPGDLVRGADGAAQLNTGRLVQRLTATNRSTAAPM